MSINLLSAAHHSGLRILFVIGFGFCLVACGGGGSGGDSGSGSSSGSSSSSSSSSGTTAMTDCGSVLHGEGEMRVRYAAEAVVAGGTCQTETQTRTCQNGVFTDWSGTFISESCVEFDELAACPDESSGLLPDFASSGNVIYVDVNHEGSSDGSSANPYKSISNAVLVASMGDEIRVRPGEYIENININKDYIHLSVDRGIGSAVLVGGATRDGGLPVVSCGLGTTISGFTIAGGNGGIECMNDAHITRNIIRGNYGLGGVITNATSRVVIQNNLILSNLGSRNDNGVGVYIGNDGGDSALPVIFNNMIVNNATGILSDNAGIIQNYNNLFFANDQDSMGTVLYPESVFDAPSFLKEEGSDFRLTQDSPAKDAGHPSCGLDQDGSRVDIGAYDGDGGHSLGSWGQTFAMESFFGFRESPDYADGEFYRYATRVVSNIPFWFDPSVQNRQNSETVQNLLSQAWFELTGYDAVFLPVGMTPSDPCQVVNISEDSARGISYGADDGQTAEQPNGCHSSPITNTTVPVDVIGGELRLPSLFWDDPDYVIEEAAAISHELGHVAGLSHCWGSSAPMCYRGLLPPVNYGEAEREAFSLLSTYSPGVELDEWREDGHIHAGSLVTFPHILDLSHLSGFFAGTEARIFGLRFTLRVSGEQAYTDTLPDYYAAPKVYINDVEIDVDMAASGIFLGGQTATIVFTVPPGVESGYLTIKARGLESNRVPVTIFTAAE